MYCDDSCTNSDIYNFQNELTGCDFVPLHRLSSTAATVSDGGPPWPLQQIHLCFCAQIPAKEWRAFAWVEGAQPPRLSVCKGPCLPPEVPQLALTCS